MKNSIEIEDFFSEMDFWKGLVGKMAKILIVDDSNFMKKIVKNIVEEAGHIVIGEASDGNEAMEKYVLLKPDLVIMDIIMNKTTGLEGLNRINIIDPKAKVIMCS